LSQPDSWRWKCTTDCSEPPCGGADEHERGIRLRGPGHKARTRWRVDGHWKVIRRTTIVDTSIPHPSFRSMPQMPRAQRWPPVGREWAPRVNVEVPLGLTRTSNPLGRGPNNIRPGHIDRGNGGRGPRNGVRGKRQSGAGALSSNPAVPPTA